MWDFLQWVVAIGLTIMVIVIVLVIIVTIIFGALTGMMSSFREALKEKYDEDAFYVRREGKWVKANNETAGTTLRQTFRTPPAGPSGGSDARKTS